MRVKSANLTIEEDGFATLRTTGTAEGLGNCACYGELVFVPGGEPDVFHGVGVVVFTAANGDRLVGVIAMQVDEATGTFSAEMHWHDSVTLHDRSILASSGRFVHNRPSGLLVVIAIIAILIG